jgi:hypothetical protein
VPFSGSPTQAEIKFVHAAIDGQGIFGSNFSTICVDDVFFAKVVK